MQYVIMVYSFFFSFDIYLARVISMEINYKRLGKRIKTARLKIDLTQAKLAELCDISNVYISHIENGTAKPSLDILYKLAIFLKVSPDYLFMLINMAIWFAVSFDTVFLKPKK